MVAIEKYHIFLLFSKPGTRTVNLLLCGNHLWMGNNILEAQPCGKSAFWYRNRTSHLFTHVCHDMAAFIPNNSETRQAMHCTSTFSLSINRLLSYYYKLVFSLSLVSSKCKLKFNKFYCPFFHHPGYTKRPVGGSTVVPCQWRAIYYNPEDRVNKVCEIKAIKRAMSINKIKHLTAIPGSRLANRSCFQYVIIQSQVVTL